MIRLYIFNNASRAAGYGIGTYVREFSEAMSSMPDTEVGFIEMYSDEEEFKIVEDDKGRIHMMIPRLKFNIEDERYCRSVFYLIARHLDIKESDRVVFQFNYFQHLPIAKLLKGQYPGCRIVLTVHYLNWCFELKGNITKFKELLKKDNADLEEKEQGIIRSFDNEQAFLHLADMVTVLSKRTQELLAETYSVSRNKMHLIYNGLGNSTGLREAKEEQTTKNVVFVGRLDEIKGLEYLISAFDIVADRHPDARLLIAGEGDFQPHLEKSRKNHGRISFLGKMDGASLGQLYEEAYIGVMPSFHEQCSYTAIEMMRHGVPIIGTDSTGLAEMLDATPQMRIHIDEEVFNEDKMVDDIARCMDILLTDDSLHNEISRILQSRYLEMYTADIMAEETREAILSSLATSESISCDYLEYLDVFMMRIIDKSPDISTDFYGMSGIGVFLWLRALQTANEVGTQNATIMEYLVYYMDWLDEASQNETLPEEMIATLQSMEKHGFYKTVVRKLLSRQSRINEDRPMPEAHVITENAFRICNCKI